MGAGDIRGLDLFCGAGGSSCGARGAGISIVGAIDAWRTAVDTFDLNFPNATTWRRRLEGLSPKTVAEELGKIDILLASPECTNHTHAKGNRRVGEEQEKSRRTANQVVRFAKVLRPRWLVVENVVAMRKWSSFGAWKKKLQKIGYSLKEIVLDAQNFGVPQSRRRLFIVGDLAGTPRLPSPKRIERIPVKDILHPEGCNGFNYEMTAVFRKKRKRAKDTLKRVRRAIKSIGSKKPFLIVYYGSDAAGGWQRVSRPLRTITTLDRFALVKPSATGPTMRMLQPPELAAAMGFPSHYKWPSIPRRERIKLVGNAVAPPVMKAIVEALITGPVKTEMDSNVAKKHPARVLTHERSSRQTAKTKSRTPKLGSSRGTSGRGASRRHYERRDA